MGKFTQEIVGGLEVAAGVAMEFGYLPGGTKLGEFLITAGAGQMISGLGTMLSKGPQKGFATVERNPIAPWATRYGRCRVGGTIVYQHSWPAPGNGGDGQYQIIDMVIVLAAHSIASVDALLFDMQRVAIDAPYGPEGVPTGVGTCVTTPQLGTGAMSAGPYPGTGTSYTPLQDSFNIVQIQRTNGVVTVTLNRNIPPLIEGDQIQISQDSGLDLASHGLIGRFQVEQIISQTFGSPGSIVFTYLCGGADCLVTGHGVVSTLWADYGRTVYFEPMLGGQSLGQTFQGMAFGTPLDGNMGDIVTPSHTGGVQGQDQPNAWPSSADGVANNASLVGKASVHIRLHFNPKYYQSIPQISFLIHGKNDIYDPRSSPPSYGYTANAALCIADFLATKRKFGGFGLSYGTQIPTADLIAAANVCDEQVPLAYSLSSPPLTENSYECNGSFTLDMTRGEILQNLLMSCAGRITITAGQWVIWPGAWTGISVAIGSNPGGGVLPVGDWSWLAAGPKPIRWRPSLPGRELYNGCKGTYISKANKWSSTDFPPYCQDQDHGYGPGGLTPAGSSAYNYDASLEADGGDRRWMEIQLPFTISAAAAQRIAKILYLRHRTPAVSLTRGPGTLVMNLAAYQIATLDLMEVTIPFMTWAAKQLEATAVRLVQSGGGNGEPPVLAVEVDVQETDATIYDWDTLEELSPAGYAQPVLPGVGSFDFFSTEQVPGYNVPYPWKPGYLAPLKGDAYFTGPVVSGVNKGAGTFGLQARYGTDSSGAPVTYLDITGTVPPSQLSSIQPPQITITVGTSGSLPPGTYVIAASAFDTDGVPTELGTAQKVVIPAGNNGSISVSIQWPFGVATSGNLGAVYMGNNDTEDGLCFQGYATGSTFAIDVFDQSTPGAPDASLDHVAVAWKKEINGGPWAQQVQAVTPTTITIGGAGITLNQLANRVLSLLGKIDSTQPLITLNMPVASNVASSTQTINGVTAQYFTVTIGPNSAGDQLPDLTTLLEVGDLLVLRPNGTFTASGVSDAMFANPYYPTGLNPDTEPGRQIVMMTGPDAGDVQKIGSLNADTNGNYTIINIAGQWKTQPNNGDLFIIVEASWGPEQHTQPSPASSGGAVVVASPQITNLAGQTWVVIVRTENSYSDNGLDEFAPIREIYDFGQQGTRTVRTSQTLRSTDRIILIDATAGPVTITLLPFSQLPNQSLFFQKIDSSANAVTIVTASGDTFTINGVTKTTFSLSAQWAQLIIYVPGQG